MPYAECRVAISFMRKKILLPLRSTAFRFYLFALVPVVVMMQHIPQYSHSRKRKPWPQLERECLVQILLQKKANSGSLPNNEQYSTASSLLALRTMKGNDDGMCVTGWANQSFKQYSVGTGVWKMQKSVALRCSSFLFLSVLLLF